MRGESGLGQLSTAHVNGSPDHRCTYNSEQVQEKTQLTHQYRKCIRGKGKQIKRVQGHAAMFSPWLHGSFFSAIMPLWCWSSLHISIWKLRWLYNKFPSLPCMDEVDHPSRVETLYGINQVLLNHVLSFHCMLAYISRACSMVHMWA